MEKINNEEKLKSYGLDKDSISEFRKKIQTSSEEEQNKLGRQIYKLVGEYFVDQEELTNLILQGANINITDKEKATSLHVCAAFWELNSAILLLKAGIDFNKKDYEGNTALHYCAGNDFLELLEILLLVGANINEKNIYGETHLMIAEDKNSKTCYKKMIEIDEVDVLEVKEKESQNSDSIFEEAAKKMIKLKK